MSKLTSVDDHADSTSPTSPYPAWPPPRTPLPPHRLAKLANALGISTPLPASNAFLTPSSPFPPTSSPQNAFPDYHRPSTPSVISSTYSSNATTRSKFLLHVFPPHHLPHDSLDSLSDLTPPPASASGYHTQFHRGVFVTLRSTLQAQLTAIAKEYALPSTTGLVLYLVSSSSQSMRNSPMPSTDPLADGDEPGPRLSEDIWKFIWSRVLRTEREEAVARSRGPTPIPFGLGVNVDIAQAQHLRPFTSTRAETSQTFGYPITPAPSTPSSLAEMRSRSAPPAPPSTTSASATSRSQQSEYWSPDTSQSDDEPQIDLPGLSSQSIIPILAKVEFDIDPRRAPWYEPWVRSRKLNHAKREESKAGERRREGEEDGEKRAPLDLKLVEGIQTTSPTPSWALRGIDKDENADDEAEYARLGDSEEDLAPPEDDFEEDATARISPIPGGEGRDPLADMFGSDAETWASIHADSDQPLHTRFPSNPHIVDLALTASALSSLPSPSDDDDNVLPPTDEVEEVRDILRRISRPNLIIAIPATSPPSKRKSSPTTAGTIRKQPPPPLVLQPSSDALAFPGPPSPAPPSTGSSTSHLAYLGVSSTPELVDSEQKKEKRNNLDVEDVDLTKTRSPAEEKRDGALFEDLDLGLEPSYDDEYDENDPNDIRRSQYLMERKLDEIEKTLAQFSPRRLKTDLDPTSSSSAHTVSSPSVAFPLTPDSDLGARGERDTIRYEGNAQLPDEVKSWPTVPFSAVSATTSNSNSPSPPRSASSQAYPSPPRLAVNGVSTGAPKAFLSSINTRLAEGESESELRKRDMNDAIYPPLLPPSFSHQMPEEDPIPLSPDPFGRYPSPPEPDHGKAYWDPGTAHLQADEYPYADLRPPMSNDESSRVTTPSSRFSADSSSVHGQVDVAPAMTTKSVKNSRMTVKGFKMLWRKSKPSISQPPTLVATRSSFQLPGSARSSISQEHNEQSPDKTLPPIPVTAPTHGKLKPSVEEYHTTHRTARPSMSESRGHSPIPPTVEKPTTRKSILKSWKSTPGLSQSSQAPPVPDPRQSPQLNDTKPRRPNYMEMSSAGRRVSAGPPDIIPPSPPLPERYIVSNAHVRANSGAFGHERRRSAARTKTGLSLSPSSSSILEDVATTSPPRNSSLTLLQTASPPRSIKSTSSSRQSQETFETSRFELVSPPKVHPHVSYTHHGFEAD